MGVTGLVFGCYEKYMQPILLYHFWWKCYIVCRLQELLPSNFVVPHDHALLVCFFFIGALLVCSSCLADIHNKRCVRPSWAVLYLAMWTSSGSRWRLERSGNIHSESVISLYLTITKARLHVKSPRILGDTQKINKS